MTLLNCRLNVVLATSKYEGRAFILTKTHRHIPSAAVENKSDDKAVLSYKDRKVVSRL